MSGLQKNVASQKWIVFAFDRTDNTPKTGDAANITANLRIDGAAADAVDDTNPTELEDGYYYFDLTQAETNGDMILICPASSTADIQVIGVPGVIFTVAPNFNALSITATTGRVDVGKWLGTAVTVSSTSAKPEVDMFSLSDDATAANSIESYVENANFPANMKFIHDDGQAAANMELFFDGTGYNAANSTIGTCTTNTDMVGTNNAALASVLGALADVAADGDPTEADTLMQYVKQLINILIGSAGIPAFPAGAAPANNVSLAEVIRAMHATLDAAAAGVTLNTLIISPVGGTSDGDGAVDGTTVLDSTRSEDTDHWNSLALQITDGDMLGQTRTIETYTSGVGFEFKQGFAAQIPSGVSYRVISALVYQPGINIAKNHPATVEPDTLSYSGISIITNSGVPEDGELTAGTITIYRIRAGVSTAIVSDAACSILTGNIYYPYTFPAASWAAGDMYRMQLSGQKVSVNGRTYDLSIVSMEGRISREAEIHTDTNIIAAAFEVV